MVSYNRIQLENRRLEVSKRNYELDFVTKTYSKKEISRSRSRQLNKAFDRDNNFNHYKLTMHQSSFKIPSETVEI